MSAETRPGDLIERAIESTRDVDEGMLTGWVCVVEFRNADGEVGISKVGPEGMSPYHQDGLLWNALDLEDDEDE